MMYGLVRAAHVLIKIILTIRLRWTKRLSALYGDRCGSLLRGCGLGATDFCTKLGCDAVDPRVKYVIGYVSENLNQQFSLPRMAELVNLSTYHLIRLFKSETGSPPIRYFQKLRMQIAKHLLETTFLRIEEVMVRVGISDASHFTHHFRKNFGQTPTQYRAQFRDGLVRNNVDQH